MKKIIYSVLVGPYDTVAPAVPFDGWEYVLYTDQPITPEGWQIRPLEWTCDCPIRTSRYNKILMPPEADITVYIDANMTLEANPDTFVQEGIGLRLHPSRTNVLEEAAAIIEQRLDTLTNVMITQARFNCLHQLYEAGLIVRNGSTLLFNMAWWNAYSFASHRDQLTLPYVIQANRIQPYIIHRSVVTYSKKHQATPQTA